MVTPDSEVPGVRDETSLAERIRQGNRAAENELVRRYSGRVLAMTLARLRDREAARELVNDVMMATVVALRRGSVRDTTRLSAFIHGTVINLVHNHLRAQYRIPHAERISDDIAGSDSADLCEKDIDMQVVRRRVEQLPLRDRQVLFMTLVDGLKPGEIASRLGLSADVVRQQKSRALKRLRDMFDGSSRSVLHEPLSGR